jgi:hypothetical protein
MGSRIARSSYPLAAHSQRTPSPRKEKPTFPFRQTDSQQHQLITVKKGCRLSSQVTPRRREMLQRRRPDMTAKDHERRQRPFLISESFTTWRSTVEHLFIPPFSPLFLTLEVLEMFGFRSGDEKRHARAPPKAPGNQCLRQRTEPHTAAGVVGVAAAPQRVRWEWRQVKRKFVRSARTTSHLAPAFVLCSTPITAHTRGSAPRPFPHPARARPPRLPQPHNGMRLPVHAAAA